MGGKRRYFSLQTTVKKIESRYGYNLSITAKYCNSNIFILLILSQLSLDKKQENLIYTPGKNSWTISFSSLEGGSVDTNLQPSFENPVALVRTNSACSVEHLSKQRLKMDKVLHILYFHFCSHMVRGISFMLYTFILPFHQGVQSNIPGPFPIESLEHPCRQIKLRHSDWPKVIISDHLG